MYTATLTVISPSAAAGADPFSIASGQQFEDFLLTRPSPAAPDPTIRIVA
jgi:hypothetical protein